MKKSILVIAAALSVSVFAGKSFAQTTDTVKKSNTLVTATVQPTGDVVSTLSTNSNFTTAAIAAKAVDLDAKLPASGTYTIFAPNNAAFGKIPQEKLGVLLKDTTKLATVLKAHVVAGKYGKAEIVKALTTGHGKATLNTVDGQALQLSISPNKTVQLTDSSGDTSEITLFDLVGTNGVVNGISDVLMPK